MAAFVSRTFDMLPKPEVLDLSSLSLEKIQTMFSTVNHSFLRENVAWFRLIMGVLVGIQFFPVES